MLNQIKEKIEYLNSLGVLVNAYEEVAANRMQKIRGKVLYNREYTSDLNDVYHEVKTSYEEALTKYKITISKGKAGRTARVFVSSNSGLYGDIIQRIFYRFLEDVKKHPSKPVVIGLLGKTLFNSAAKTDFAYFDLPDSEVETEAVLKMVDYLKDFETVIVYHGVFKNLLMQEVALSDITGGELLPRSSEEKRTKIIFEPSLFEVYDFFGKEIFASLLFYTLYEAILAKFSSRISSLYNASENIQKNKKLAILEREREKRRIMNKKQLEQQFRRLTWNMG